MRERQTHMDLACQNHRGYVSWLSIPAPCTGASIVLLPSFAGIWGRAASQRGAQHQRIIVSIAMPKRICTISDAP